MVACYLQVSPQLSSILSMMQLFLPPLLLLLSVHASSSPCSFPAIFNFGDSNSDTGGFSAAFWPAPPPYGQTFAVQPAGRFSDGRLVIDFLAEGLGLPYLSAYLDSVGTNFSHGANFATYSSTIMDQNESLSRGGYSPFSLGLQLEQFDQFKTRSQLVYKRGGVFADLMPREEYFTQALYTVDIGQNDLTQWSFANKTAEDFVPRIIELFTAVIKGIYETGGRYFWIHNTGPLGCLPHTLIWTEATQGGGGGGGLLDSVGCAITYNELAQQFNRMLNETVVKLRRDLPLATLTYVDIYSVKYLLISRAEEYGFEDTIKACCGYGGGAYNYDPTKTCGYAADVKACENPSKRIMWDGIHYSEAANRWVAERISTGEFSDPPNSPCYFHSKPKPKPKPKSKPKPKPKQLATLISPYALRRETRPTPNK